MSLTLVNKKYNLSVLGTHCFFCWVQILWATLTFLKQQEFPLFPITMGGGLSVPSALQAKGTFILSLEFFPSLQGPLFKLSVLLGGSLNNSTVPTAL
jgi:hypothetical protein